MNTLDSLQRRHWLGAALATGLAPAFLRHAWAADQPRFAQGVASGFPRPDGMVLWTRLTGPDLPERVEVQWEVAHDERFSQMVAKGTCTAEAAWAHSVHAEPAGLAPDRWYFYRFRALGDQSSVGRTRSTPAPDAVRPLRFVIASCQRYDAGHFAAWRQAVTDAPDLVVFLGDYIYEYASRADALRRHEGGAAVTLDQYRARYATYQSDPLLQAAHAACPWVSIWDDHEVENDYAGLQSQTLDPAFRFRRSAAYQAHWEHLPYPQALRPDRGEARIHGTLDWGALARLIRLDGRQFRDPQVCPKPGRGGSNTLTRQACPAFDEPGRSLLGRPQEQWLANAWDDRRPWNLLAQPTLMSPFSWTDPGAPEGGTWWTDGWDGYAPARQRLLDDLAARRVANAVVLGGDVHTHYVSQLHRVARDPASPILASEFCGSSITSPSLPQSRVAGALPFNPHVLYGRADQRGTISFVLTPQRLEATLTAVDNLADPASPVRVAARYVVEAGKPGPVAA
ncbi:alkaline phosphatase D family protein [Ideonella margarita]|uniref:Alkaline phosphatase D family protein n=1 Tax=Ideonella margarita TaxID=2984191 RepID=A0ABU9C7Q8_9BURK